MKVIDTRLPGVVIVEPDVFPDSRGLFLESWNKIRYEQAGMAYDWIQDNISVSTKGVLRGLHFQNPNAQAKLVQAMEGEIFDVVVDIRIGSPTYGKWESALLSSENRRQLAIPGGFAHGFMTLSDRAVVGYKVDDVYVKDSAQSISWNDPDIGIDWPLKEARLSEKDAIAPRLKDMPPGALPLYTGD
ncbi:MAG: dTDP-4-dehydrorhamnose 3,5-epimerase [Nitrospinota bacterium]|nr:dTDP-4-dehydrorhamnose 3,5-epimerase [Nitrospinota bacterium]